MYIYSLCYWGAALRNYIFNVNIPKASAIANESSVPVNTYSDFSLPDDASLNRRMDFAAIRKPIASY